LLNTQQNEKQSSISDLENLLKQSKHLFSYSHLSSPLYRQHFEQFRLTLLEQQQIERKRRRELETSEKLLADKVIARLEHEDKQFAYESAVAQTNALIERQRSEWQQELTQYQQDLIELEAQLRQLQQEEALYTIKAPVNGTISQLAGRYPGSYVQPGEVLAVISPDSTLIVETYVSPKDIGLLQPGQPVRFQVDAFDYNQWGFIEGKILSLANDFSLVDGKPVFKVRCSLNQTTLRLKNGYQGTLKKGMTVRARFQIARRSLFQLLYDKADDWLNPANNQPALARQ